MGFNDLPCSKGHDATLVEGLIEVGLASSKREAREFIRNGAVTLNGDKVTDESFVLNSEAAIEGKFIVLRRGKKKYALIRF